MVGKASVRVAVMLSGVAVLAANSPAHVRADDFYVAVDGNDSMPGTEQAPFATVERAQSAASPGDTVYIRGGLYRFTDSQRTIGVAFSKSGQPDRPIRYFAYPGELPIFDLRNAMPQARVTGLDVHASWLHIRGLEVTRVRQLIVGDSWGVRIRGDHNVLEGLHVHHCEAPGVFITSGGDNQIINCDSHHNYDPLENGENADGFGCHSTGGNNVFHGCRAYHNADDGFDFINAPGTCTVEYSWSFHNGFVPDSSTPAGNGAGFKSGGFGYPPKIPATGVPRHTVRFNMAFDNRAQGFYANHHPGGLDFISNTAFDNPANFDMRVTDATSTHLLRNNLAALSGVAVTNYTGGSNEFNSWTLPVTVNADDFQSIDKTAATAARAADGSLPEIGLMRLRDDSDLIDRGEDRGFPFAGDAPDLGAFESGLVTPVEPLDAGMGMPADPEPMDVDAGMMDMSPTGPATTPTEPAGPMMTGNTTPPAGNPPVGNPAGPSGPAPTAAPQTPVADPGSTGTVAATPTTADGSSSCGCRLVSAKTRRARTTAVFVLGLLALACRRRRRRTSTRGDCSAAITGP